MKNRTLFFTAGLIIIIIISLVGVSLYSILGSSEHKKNIDPNQISGIELIRFGRPYTLSFDQQNGLLYYLNRSIPFDTPHQIEYPLAFEKIVIYRFDQEPLIITPVTSLNNQLIFFVPSLNRTGLMIDTSQGKLKELILTTVY